MNYPTIAEVVAADRDQIAFWWCFLPEPSTPLEERALDLIFKKYYVTGGVIGTKPRKKSRRAAGQ